MTEFMSHEYFIYSLLGQGNLELSKVSLFAEGKGFVKDAPFRWKARTSADRDSLAVPCTSLIKISTTR